MARRGRSITKLSASVCLMVLAAATARGEDAPPYWLQSAPRVRPGDPAIERGSGRVRWMTFSSSSFAFAKEQNRPVLLFVTAHWAHWGRVMERSTFTDLEVATRLNEEFAPVRLNRD